MATNRKQVLYAASTPLDAAASATTYSTDAGSRGLVPYVSKCSLTQLSTDH